MEVEYRRMRVEDEYQAYKLWADTFGDGDAEVSRRYLAPDADYLDHTLLAVFSDNTIAATLHYWLYPMRDDKGNSRLVGAISHVATREEHRRKGYAAKLLEWSFEDMLAKGCEWTLLFSSKMGVPLYERHGFQRYSHPYRRGILNRQSLERKDGYTIKHIESGEGEIAWSYLAPIFDAYNAMRPLIRTRDDWYWRVYFPLHIPNRFNTQASPVYVATAPNGELCGYMLAYLSSQEMAREHFKLDQMVTLGELCVLPGHSEAISTLISAALENIAEGNVGGRLFLPYEEPINTIADAIFGGTLTEHDDRQIFARPLSPGFTHDDIKAIFSAPGATFWPLDDF